MLQARIGLNCLRSSCSIDGPKIGSCRAEVLAALRAIYAIEPDPCLFVPVFENSDCVSIRDTYHLASQQLLAEYNRRGQQEEYQQEVTEHFHQLPLGQKKPASWLFFKIIHCFSF